jgi:F-type H+-transporting ATPase subunit delta
VIPSAVLGRYARSLAEVVFEENIEEKVTADLEAYGEIFKALPEMLGVFHSPAVPRESKEKLLEELTVRYPVHPVTSNFLRILLQHNRIRFFEQIRQNYLKSVNESKGIISARVTAAEPLSADEVKKLADRLSGITGKLVNVESQTDPDLLGGIVVEVASTVFDGSIRTQLSEIRRRLAETQ